MAEKGKTDGIKAYVRFRSAKAAKMGFHEDVFTEYESAFTRRPK